jgi:hypothetical protein
MPKAGGSTLQEIIQRQYPPTATFDIQGEGVKSVQSSVDRLRHMPEPERARIACVKGHVPFGIHRWLPGTPRYLTMLRDPVQRIVSDYFFALNTPGHALFERMHRDRLCLKDFVLLRTEQRLNDIYCRLLSESVTWNSLADSPPALPANALGTAKENLARHFALVGITERFDESLLLAQTAFGWKDIRYERANVTRDKPSQVILTRAELDAIRLYNRQDIELYEFAMQLMDARIAEEAAGFEARLRRFRLQNKRYGIWRRLRRVIGRVAHARYIGFAAPRG